MAPTTKPTTSQMRNLSRKQQSVLRRFYKNYINFEFVKFMIFDPAALPIVSVLIILAEIFLNIIIIRNVPYTEIDWKAYMQECEGFLNGTTNYALLKGDTGPLVYPAGFVYIYSALYFITSQGKNIRLAQYIFAAIYILQLNLVLRLYIKSRKVPPYILVLSVFTSYRIHSIYLLRLFNDPFAILFLYASLNAFLDRKWTFGSVLFSLGVGVKMNILLFAPALLLFYITNLGYWETLQQLIICACVQNIIGAPFLFTYPMEYIRGSFDLSRIFEHKWTVNYRFLSVEIFESKTFHIGLLILHLGLLIIFAKPTYIFFKNYCRLRELEIQLQPQINKKNAEQPKDTKKSKVTKEIDEELTPEQTSFLKSYEEGLKKNAATNSNVTKQIEIEETELEENYSIHFDKCSQLALLPLFLSNFIGVFCARSLHYQFYVWYFHSLPYLIWSTNYSLGVRYLLLGIFEYCWNAYPSTNFSSAMLHWAHLLLLYGVGRNMFMTTTNSAALAYQDDKNNSKNSRVNKKASKSKSKKA